ncbi:hypothetical protein D3C79_826370 [compost metagenome]
MALSRQRHQPLLALAWQQAADLGHHQVPVAQQIEAHHRDQHQVGQPTEQRQPRRCSPRQNDTDDVAGLPHVTTDGRFDLVELPEAFGQPKTGLHPGQGAMLQPVEHLRCQLVETHQLLGQHRHQHQQQQGKQQGKQGEHQHHAPGAGQPGTLQTIYQGIGQVGQEDAH